MPKKIEKKNGILKNLINKENKTQLFARIPTDKFEKFKEICDQEQISMYKGVEVALDVFFEYYEREAAKLKKKV